MQSLFSFTFVFVFFNFSGRNFVRKADTSGILQEIIVYSFLFQSLENDDVVVLLVPVFKVVEAFQEMRDRNSISQALWSFLHIIYCTFLQKKISCNKIKSNQSTFSKNSVFEVQRCYTCEINKYKTFLVPLFLTRYHHRVSKCQRLMLLL